MTAKQPRQTEYVPLDSLKPDPRNPKSHHIETIDASVGRFGYIDSIVRDDRTGFIISGHGRAKTLIEMRDRGETPPEGILTNPKGEWLVPVATGWSSRTDSEATAALIALNRTTELGGWVDDALLDLLDELSGEDDGLAGVGFTQDDIDALARLAESLGEGVDAHAEFEKAGIGGFDNEDGAPHFQCKVSFATEEDYEEFRRLLGYTGPRRGRIWYPEQPDQIESGMEFVAVEGFDSFDSTLAGEDDDDDDD